MKTPRLALLVALFAAAATAHAADLFPAPGSLEGWTALNALQVADPDRLTTGAAYTEGVVYCDLRKALRTDTSIPFLPMYNCVVVGRPTKKAGAKVGGLLASGQAYYQRSTSPVLTRPGGSGNSLLLKIGPKKIPYADKIVMLTTAIPDAQVPYTSYVEGGKPLSAPAAGRRTTKPGSAGQKTPDAILMSAKEQLWLDKRQAADYAADKAAAKKAAEVKTLVDKYRKLVVENLQPNTAASGAYTAAAADAKATPKTIDAALPPEVWGGKNDAVVGFFGEKTEIQLSEPDYKTLSTDKKYEAALKTYKDLRGGADGRLGQAPEYNAKYYDPIVLHRTAEAARKAMGKTAAPPVVATKPDDGKLLALLNDEQMKFLTPKELAEYTATLGSAPKPKDADKSVQNLLKTLLANIEARKGSPYPEGGLTEATFDKAPGWQKDRFCDPNTIGMAAANNTEAKLDFDPKSGTLTDLQRIEADKVAAMKASAAKASKPLPSWAVGKCKGAPFYVEPAASGVVVDHGDSNGVGGNLTTGSGKPNGPDATAKEEESTVANSWLMRTQLQTAAKGSLIGLVIGSLFGPIGLIAGPLLGAALFYGMQKYDAVQAAKKEKE